MKITCPSCFHERPDFCFADDGRCTTCHMDEAREASVVVRTMADVRHRRDVLLARTDWTRLDDVPVAVRDAWTIVRQELRDVTDHATADEAWSALIAIEAANFS